MSAVKYKPELAPTAAVLADAIAASGLTKTAIAKALKISGGAISNMAHAKSRVNQHKARQLGALLKIKPAALISPTAMGPAARAALLHADTSRVTSPPPPTPAVMGMTAHADGTMSIWLKTTLPVIQGATLVRYLLDFGLIIDGQNGNGTTTSAPIGTGKG